MAHKTFVQQAKPFIFPSGILGIFQEFSKNSTALCFFYKNSVYIWIAVEYLFFLAAKANVSGILQKSSWFSIKFHFIKNSNLNSYRKKRLLCLIRHCGGREVKYHQIKVNRGLGTTLLWLFFYLFCYLSIVLTAWIQYTNNLVVIFFVVFFSFASIAGRENQEHWSIITYCVTTR